MDPSAYSRMADNEQRHWWFAGRRAILATLLRRELAHRAGPVRILEAGCGSGGNLGMLQSFGEVDAVEYDAGARNLAALRSGLPIRACTLPHDLPVPDEAYDLIVLLDVLEHIEEDRSVLAVLKSKLKPNGRLLVTVPALPWLWSNHDEIHHHKRRYTSRSLMRTALSAGLHVSRISYFNTLLFPAALARRIGSILSRRPVEDDRMPARPLNSLLRSIFSAERHLVGRLPLPVGLSVYAVLVNAK